MSYVPPTLTDLGFYWTKQNGVNLGVVGNQKHCAGYHLGKDRIFSTCACKPDGTCEPGKRWADYSVQLDRDKAGLTNAASAIDLGRLNGSLEELYKFSRWLVAQCQAKAAGYIDVREIIYSPDGVNVQRWSGVDGLIHTGPGNGDGSHTSHTHISYFRDSEKRDKRPLFAPYFSLPDTSTEVPVGVPVAIDARFDGTCRVSGPGHAYITVNDGILHPVADGWPGTAGKEVIYLGHLYADFTTPGGTLIPKDTTLVGVGLNEAVLLRKDVVLNPRPVDCSDAVAAQRERDRVAVHAKVDEVYSA